MKIIIFIVIIIDVYLKKRFLKGDTSELQPKNDGRVVSPYSSHRVSLTLMLKIEDAFEEDFLWDFV